MSDLPVIANPERKGPMTWFRSQLWTGVASTTAIYMPNKGDFVIDLEQGFFVVDTADHSTLTYTLKPWSPLSNPDEDPTDDNLVGTGPGYVSERYRGFLNTSVTPHTLVPDSVLYWKGSMVDHYRVFLGTDVNPNTGTIISTYFDPSGNFLGDAIPVESAEIPTDDGQGLYTVKVPLRGYCNRTLNNGELITLVAYNEDDEEVSLATLVVYVSGAVPVVGDSRRYISGITLDTAWASSSDPNVIEFPVNATVESIPMTGVVHYSNGERQRFALGGNRFAVYGLDNFIATVPGSSFKLGLVYTLANDEIAYQQLPTVNNKITAEYIARTMVADGAYSVKLFGYPSWVSGAVGYRMEYWLYNLDRQQFYNVTPYIEAASNSQPFNPTLYGSLQTITVAIDLNRVDGVFRPYRHVQTFQIALLTRGDSNDANWSVAFTPDQDTSYGVDLFADLELVSLNNWRLRLGNGFQSKEIWLQNMYQRAEPLYNPEIEGTYPEPTHFRVRFANNTYEFSVDQWDDVLGVNNDRDNGALVYIQWIRRTADTDLQLAMTALPARRRST